MESRSQVTHPASTGAARAPSRAHGPPGLHRSAFRSALSAGGSYYTSQLWARATRTEYVVVLSRRPGQGHEHDEQATPTRGASAGGGCAGSEFSADAPCAAESRARHVASSSRQTAGLCLPALLVTIRRICLASDGHDLTEGALRPAPTIPRQGGVSVTAPGPTALQPERRRGGVRR